MGFNGIGIGISDFKALRLRKNYFIDKTLFIKDIIDNQSGVVLITRPRRFGKTLNMSMLRYFFDCNVKEGKDLFNGLKIMEQDEKYTSKLGAYPCIYLTMKDLNVSTYEYMLMQLKTAMMEIYFETLEDYIKNILPIKIRIDGTEKYSKIIEEYEEYEKFSVGKLDERDFLEKNMILLGLSRVLFTHSLPLVAAEQCYKKLLKDTRNLIVNSKVEEKREATYKMLLELIEAYNVKLLSTKVYWDKPSERDDYKKFWDAYSKTNSSKEKEILSLKRELYDTQDEYEKYAEVRKFYKNKLVDLGVMKNINGIKKNIKGHFTKL